MGRGGFFVQAGGTVAYEKFFPENGPLYGYVKKFFHINFQGVGAFSLKKHLFKKFFPKNFRVFLWNCLVFIGVMGKQIIKLNESRLRGIISEVVTRILCESEIRLDTYEDWRDYIDEDIMWFEHNG